MLLLATLLRLALNVASTRIVLLEGHTGTDAAGKVIEAFGDFVVGGNYAVGIVVFAILVIINFVVVTKGAGRVSEVSARFTLDALPGKQMAIDADLNAGIIDQEEAAQRRNEIRTEADFYGSMDGASKFVRGDAIAGLLILFINLLGGMLIGTLQHDMSMSDRRRDLRAADHRRRPGRADSFPAARHGSGDHRHPHVARSEDMGTQMMSQLLGDKPGAARGGRAAGGARPGAGHAELRLPADGRRLRGLPPGTWSSREQVEDPIRPKKTCPNCNPAEDPLDAELTRELSWDDVGEADAVALDVGYRLIPLVDRNQGGELMRRIKGVRRRLSEELGFLISPVRIRDDLDLPASGYRISLIGSPLAQGEVHVDKELAINPGHIEEPIAGIPTQDPAFGLEAVWIDPAQREEAQARGYTVVDVATVIATHMSKLLQEHAHELLGHQEAQELLDRLGAHRAEAGRGTGAEDAAAVDRRARAAGTAARPGAGYQHAQHLPGAGRTGSQQQDPDALVAQVRVALGRSIVQRVSGEHEELPVITLDPSLEQMLQQAVQGETGAVSSPAWRRKCSRSWPARPSGRRRPASRRSCWSHRTCAPGWRDSCASPCPALKVLAYNEVPDSKRIRLVAAVGA